MLEQLSGETHQVVTGICLLHLRDHRQKVFSETSSVKFRPLDGGENSPLPHAVNPLDKAGAYAIQERGEEIIENISGSYTNIVGLPVERLREELESWTQLKRQKRKVLKGQLLPQPRAHRLAFRETIQIEFFVRRMRIVVRQTQAEEQRIRAEDFFELVHDGNRAALAHQDRLAAKCALQRA